MFYFIKELFQFRSDLFWRNIKRPAKETKHLFLNNRKVFHFCHKAINRLDQRFQDRIVSQFVMCHQMQEAGITLQIETKINGTINYFLKRIDGRFIFPRYKIKNGYFIIE